MARKSSYRHQVSEIVNWNQIKANNETIFLLREIGPFGFLVQEEGSEKKHKVCLGDPHTCSCKDFKKEKDLCKHICWLFLKKFRLDRDNPLTWQFGLVERELNEVLYGRSDVQSKYKLEKTRGDTSTDDANIIESSSVQQRKIDENDVCPICQDDLLNIQRPVTYCRGGCGNSIHVRCMSVWTDHKRKELNLKIQDSVPCPVCRGEFASIHLLSKELQNSCQRRRKIKSSQQTANGTTTAVVRHHGSVCVNCQVQPITGHLYKCSVCTSLVCLCATCFSDSSVHSEHTQFQFREYANGKWNTAPASRSIPESMLRSLQTQDIQQFDYNLLQKLDNPPSLAAETRAKQHQVNSLPSWILTQSSKLVSEPGHQCRLCLMSYKLRDHVRKLPQCQHIYHSACIDPWLVHKSATCPLDDAPVVRVQSVSSQPQQQNHQTLGQRRTRISSLPTSQQSQCNNDSNISNGALSISALHRPNSTHTQHAHPISNPLHITSTADYTMSSHKLRHKQLPPLLKYPQQSTNHSDTNTQFIVNSFKCSKCPPSTLQQLSNFPRTL